jgi:drug/metabolite transporter (DMT)-like permease
MKVRWGGWGSPQIWVAFVGIMLIAFALDGSSNRSSVLNGLLIALGLLLLIGLLIHIVLTRLRHRP